MHNERTDAPSRSRLSLLIYCCFFFVAGHITIACSTPDLVVFLLLSVLFHLCINGGCLL